MRVTGILGRDWNEMSIIILIIGFPCKFIHVSIDYRIGRKHGYPIEEKCPFAVNPIGIFCFMRGIESFAKEACICSCQVCISAAADAIDDCRICPVPYRKELDSGILGICVGFG